ncbi:cytochrome P450 [Mollisia scopiformis]|uniref:Cytochrome P450 n=1 Tax=Mollisia scopiformis TaxID=149040 RepID=A0A194X9E4_MOLSC|nr:cytochrome P450 [Mollisia scopiformis]KUJ16402.1 cytochrome P450 [Mollisia scopiformis]
MDPTTLLFQATILSGVCCIGVVVYLRYFYVDFGRIEGIPEIPGGSSVAGHLYMLGQDHATTAESWAISNTWPVYQIRFGYRRAIILNSFDAAREWIVTKQTSTIDRPWLYTFHGVVSKTSATIGTNPWDERTKKQRRVVGSYTTAPAIRKLEPMLDVETSQMISGLYEDGKHGIRAISPHIYQKRLALNIILMFCYSRRFAAIDDPLLLGILSDANTISSFRSTNSNAQDYIPYLRHFGGGKRTVEATEVRGRRDRWLAGLLEKARDSVRLGKAKKCVAQGLLVDKEEGLTKQDIRTILGGLMSGGFETVFATAIIGIAFLASPAGEAAQKSAHADITSNYSTPQEAFERAALEEKSPYIAAFVREVLRFYPPLHLLPPRQTYQEFEYHGSKIPKGVLVYMNAQAINHDKDKYGPDADQFRPERWLDKESGYEVPPPYHFSYGAGARMCTAVNFSNRILYAIFLRLIVSFEIIGSKEDPPETHYIDYNRNTTAASAIPKDFKARFVPRDVGILEECLRKSQETEVDLAG